MKTSFLFLADGFEEVEALTPVDILRRGGIKLETVSVMENREVTGAHGVTVVADHLLKQVADREVDFLIFPGGMPGALNLSESKPLMDWLLAHFKRGGNIAAICAAPALVLGKLPLAPGVKLTCYPGFEEYLKGVQVVTDGVVKDGQFITGKGPAWAASFGLAVLEKMTDARKAKEVAEGMLLTELK